MLFFFQPSLKSTKSLRILSNRKNVLGKDGSLAIAYVKVLEKCKDDNDVLQLLVCTHIRYIVNKMIHQMMCH